jgi:predicted nuclease of predicted toxin-antitoxin system
MKFLLDVNVAGSVSEYLQESGYAVAEVIEEDPRMPDKAILEYALKKNRILVTTDKDFEEMIWQRGQNHCGVLRIENLPRTERMALVKDVLMQHVEDLKSGSIVIATQKKYRIRKPFSRP